MEEAVKDALNSWMVKDKRPVMASTKAAMRFHQTGAMWRETETREKKSNVERIQRKKDASFNKEKCHAKTYSLFDSWLTSVFSKFFLILGDIFMSQGVYRILWYIFLLIFLIEKRMANLSFGLLILIIYICTCYL